MKVVATRGYDRRAARLLSAEERAAAEAEIVARPEAWPVIPGTGGARKARIAFRGRGKSGGARVIYFFCPTPEFVALLDIYAKSAKEDLSHAERNDLREILEAIRTELGD